MNRGFEFNTPARIRITGYVDITAQEFQTHYEPALDECIGRGDTYILSDEAGLCQIALEYLTERKVPATHHLPQPFPGREAISNDLFAGKPPHRNHHRGRDGTL